uniref:NADH-ubiquinone oxidoreductase chain 4L n=1 Tax=Campodea fragilis TaxID=383857 RepID=Q0ZD09_9HEXA|nr:NADH dehydrogenase subunit 4L [Campodea fragilis]ABF49571.1 NADH dehydrogenase subunit 4L [Campodea fragilis]
MLLLMMIIGVLIGSWGLMYKHKHMLIMLLMIEYCVVNLFGVMCLMFSFYSMDLYFMLIFLTFGVCEGALGLGILISMARMFGNDYFMLISILEC